MIVAAAAAAAAAVWRLVPCSYDTVVSPQHKWELALEQNSFGNGGTTQTNKQVVKVETSTSTSMSFGGTAGPRQQQYIGRSFVHSTPLSKTIANTLVCVHSLSRLSL